MDANTAALNHYEIISARKDAEHLAKLNAQKNAGINAVKNYAHDIANNKDFLQDCAGTLDGLGVVAELLFLAQQDTITAGIYLHRIATALIRDRALQEEIESDGIYSSIDHDLTISKATAAIDAAIQEIKKRGLNHAI